jgi:MYXO-CTERM domain-containing protein
MHIWNYNEASFTSRGAGNVEILISSTTNVADLVHLDNAGANFTFAQANGQSTYAGFNLDLSQVTNAAILEAARLVRFNILSNYGDQNGYVGLSEVQFTAAVPESALIAVLPLAGLACFAARRRRRTRSGVLCDWRY